MKQKCALLLVAHGSRLEDANQEIADMAQRLRDAVGPRYSQVTHAFLEMAQPSIAQGIEACVADGAEAIDVLPYFLAAGRHVREDVPQIIEQARTQHPQVRIHLHHYLGLDEGMPQMLAQLVQKAS